VQVQGASRLMLSGERKRFDDRGCDREQLQGANFSYDKKMVTASGKIREMLGLCQVAPQNLR
jgi:hypothetical protein